MRLHAQLSQITAIVQLCYSIRQLQLSYPSTIGGAVSISTSGKQGHLWLTSLRHQLPRHSRKMAYEERDEATSLYTSYMVYMIITQTRGTMALFLAVISEERRRRPSTSGSRPRGKISHLRRTQNPIRSAGTYTCRRNATINRIICVL